MRWTEERIIKFWQNETERRFTSGITSKQIIKLSKKYIGKDVLDIGAGSGSFMNILKSKIKDTKVIGVDIFPRKKSIIKADLNSLPFDTKSFDTVFAIYILEHLYSKQLLKGLKEIRRCLRPKGYLIAVVPYQEDLSENKMICPKCGSHFHRGQHLQSFNEERINYFLKKNNLKTIKIKKIWGRSRFKLFNVFPLNNLYKLLKVPWAFLIIAKK